MKATATITAISLSFTKAWHISPSNKITRWGLLVNACSLQKSALSLLLAESNNVSEGECSATPQIANIPLEESTSATAPTSSLTRKPKSGDIVTFTLHRFDSISSNNDEYIEPLFDASGTLHLILNDGQYVPSLHSLLATMTPGETVRNTVIDGGYGPIRPELKFAIPTSSIGNSIDTSLVKVGTKLAFGEVECRIVSISEEEWICDANHPLSGCEYEVDVTLERVEEGIRDWGFMAKEDVGVNGKYGVATFALGCFWGGELAYQRMPGVISTNVGYTQGNVPNPTYEEVCTGATGHTEAIRVVYDPDIVSYESLVKLGLDRLGDNVYKLNQMGNDKGTQYRHGIYYHTEEQKEVAEELLAELDLGDGKEVKTEVKQATDFYLAEDYHQKYLLKGGQSAKKGSAETIRCYG